MRIKLLVLTVLFLFFGVRVTFAVSFTISNPQYHGDEITIDILLSGLTSSSCLNGYCYLQAAFTSPSPIRYFGFTKNNNGQWYQYISSPTQSYIQSTFFTFQPVGGTWSGQLTLKVNTEDSNYHGAGTYNIKAWRYSGNSSSASGDSDSISVNIQIPVPSPSSISTPAPSVTPTPSSNPSNSSTSSFIVSNTPSQINSDQSFNVSVNLTLPNNRNSDYYLSGAFKKADGTRYFGLTKINSSWIKYESSNYLNQYKITTDDGGNWTGTLEVKPDTSDTNYKGSGDYIFKVGRYTSSGSGPTWSNESIIKIISLSPNQESPANSKTPSQESSITNAKTTKTGSNPSKSNDTLVYHIASVAAATASATESSAPSTETGVKNQKTNLFIWLGLAFIFAGVGTLGYIYFKKNAKIPI